MINSQSLFHNLNRYIAGDDSAANGICQSLEPLIRSTVMRKLSSHDPDGDDVIQDSMLALLTYLRKSGNIPENPEAFVVTIAKNRCTNLHIWRRPRQTVNLDDLADKLPNIGVSALDLIEKEQRLDLLRHSLEGLQENCRNLLKAIYGGKHSIEELRSSLNLNSVQAVYYRRDICLKNAEKILKRRLFACQTNKTGKNCPLPNLTSDKEV